eukprot:EG_transcript_16636
MHPQLSIKLMRQACRRRKPKGLRVIHRTPHLRSRLWGKARLPWPTASRCPRPSGLPICRRLGRRRRLVVARPCRGLPPRSDPRLRSLQHALFRLATANLPPTAGPPSAASCALTSTPPSPVEPPSEPTPAERRTSQRRLKLAAKLEYLEDLGVDGERLLKVRPAWLKGSLLSMAEMVHFLRQAGVPPAPAIRTSPSLLTCSVKSLEPKLRYLLDVVGYTVDDLRRCPKALTHSLQGRIIPRYTALQAARRRLPSLSTFVCQRADAFQRSLERPARRFTAARRPPRPGRPVALLAECSCPGCPCTEQHFEL